MSYILTPELVLVVAGLILLLIEAFAPKLPKKYIGYLSGLSVATAIAIFSPYPDSYNNASFWVGFNYSGAQVSCAKLIILLSSLMCIIMLIDFRGVLNRYVSGDVRNADGTGELFILPLFATAGMMWMCSADNFISLFVALELTTLTFYTMVGYMRRNVGSTEGGIKYLLTGALSAGIMVFGIAWYYVVTGSFQLDQLMETILNTGTFTPALSFSLILIGLGLLFKVGAVPMQAWAPDVYQGAPAPITAFLSVASKTAGMCVLFTFLNQIISSGKSFSADQQWSLMAVLSVIVGATLIVGNLGAIAQTNVKRLLGYSSIGHAGYILPLVIIGTPDYNIYLIAYMVMTFGALYVLSILRKQMGTEDLNAFKGLGKRNPRLAAVTTLMFASLAGLPLTGGFTAKLYSFMAIIAMGNLWLLGIAVVTAAAGFYYYFKPIRSMYWEKSPEGAPEIKVPLLTGVMLAVLSFVIIVLGLYPIA